MEVKKYAVEGPVLVNPRVFKDERGFFMESYNYEAFAAIGITCAFVQDNHSKSVAHTLRGLHYQVNRVQDKLVRVVRGAVYDVAVDIRPDSPTFGQWVGELLSAENCCQLFVPGGFAHGFQVVGDSAEVIYKCSDFYSPADERGILWSDPDLAMNWPYPRNPVLSAKDRAYPLFKDLQLA